MRGRTECLPCGMFFSLQKGFTDVCEAFLWCRFTMTQAADDAEASYLEDLRRLTAEYANYRKRTEANVEIDKQRATAAVVSQLISVVDDLDRRGDVAVGIAAKAGDEPGRVQERPAVDLGERAAQRRTCSFSDEADVAVAS